MDKELRRAQLLIAAYLGEPDNVGSEVLVKLKEAMKW